MLTRADIDCRSLVNKVHIDYARGSSAWVCGIDGVPRLSLTIGSHLGKGHYRDWSVDGERVRDLEAALGVINGTMTIEEAKKPATRTVKRVPLPDQIREVERELGYRDHGYDRLVAAGKITAKVANLQLERMVAVKATLEWLQENEVDVRAYIAARAEARKKAEGEAA